MSRPRLTVGSLRGVPQPGVVARARPPRSGPALSVQPGPSCCRRGCAGCPWAEAMRRLGPAVGPQG